MPQGAAAAAALMVCASGEALFPHGAPTGHVGSGAASIHAQTPVLDTCPSCGPTTNRPEHDAQSRRPPGPPQCMLGSCGGGLHFLGSPSLLHSCVHSAPMGTRIRILLGLLRLDSRSTVLISQELRIAVHPPAAMSGVCGAQQPLLPSWRHPSQGQHRPLLCQPTLGSQASLLVVWREGLSGSQSWETSRKETEV